MTGQGPLHDMLAQLPAEQAKKLVDTLTASGPQFFERPAVPSRRRGRRAESVTYRVRAALDDTAPQVWRRLELFSGLYLDQVHDVLQAVFDWDDAHLHQFGSGPEYYDRRTEYYLCPFQVEEGEAGVPEERVRLDEVLVDIGDKLFYCYDFGDDWHVTLTVEAVLAHEAAAPLAICVDGAGPHPLEDCGGTFGLAQLVAANDAAHPEHARTIAEFAEYYGDTEIPSVREFSAAEVNETLSSLELSAEPNRPIDPHNASDAALSDVMRDVVSTLRYLPPRRRRTLQSLIDRAGLDTRLPVDPSVAAAATTPYRTLLDLIGRSGVTLTSAGYLPPSVVTAVYTELGMDRDWIGKGNREDQTAPVLLLRESAQRLGLLFKRNGKLRPTRVGMALAADPVALWQHLAQRTAAEAARVEDVAAQLFLVTVAAGLTDTVEPTLLELLQPMSLLPTDTLTIAHLRSRSFERTIDPFDRMNMRHYDIHRMGFQYNAEAAQFARTVLVAPAD
ncbi:plasmid pRiA4b ORF-3 family protein [Nocardia aurantiaca]|uniref:Plasmid pRiA4b ORF-3 family protein n=1 Tax=Nocardia aurantiaca TaxID=2675850 RepID=A0A6I3KSK1_9NOCA|nr:plasmid pRiA4b ORF-3 family protein [Nocardia aurantiaca]MTE11520.1 plasmid pRiA4b ORF-3 family protein [Nocardia aurantiaca]